MIETAINRINKMGKSITYSNVEIQQKIVTKILMKCRCISFYIKTLIVLLKHSRISLDLPVRIQKIPFVEKHVQDYLDQFQHHFVYAIYF